MYREAGVVNVRTVGMKKMCFHGDPCSLETQKWMPLIGLV